MMAAIDRHDDELPPEVSTALTDVGLAPSIATLLQIITDFPRLQAEARASAEIGVSVTPINEQWPIKGLLPSHVSYETGRKACARGILRAELIGSRWFATEAAVAEWLAKTGRNRR
jgi:hypothetical protein